MTRVALLAALVFLAGSAPNAVLPSAQRAEKVQGAAQPGPRSQPALLFHDRLRKLVLLDGTYSAVRPEHSEIWIWDGRAWALIPSTGPTGRYASAAVYDSRRDRIVSFSGRVGRRADHARHMGVGRAELDGDARYQRWSARSPHDGLRCGTRPNRDVRRRALSSAAWPVGDRHLGMGRDGVASGRSERAARTRRGNGIRCSTPTGADVRRRRSAGRRPSGAA